MSINQPFDEEQTLRAWQRFVQMGELMPYVPAPIARSWFRCKNRGQLLLQLLPHDLPSSRLEPHEQKMPLMHAFQQTFEDLANFLETSELLLAVVDPEGVLLDWLGSTEILVSGSLKQGYRLQEETLGTMAISLALQEREPFFVRGAQHYYSCYHQLTSFAVPLIIGDNFLGALGAWAPVQTSTLAVVSVSLGRRVIESNPSLLT